MAVSLLEQQSGLQILQKDKQTLQREIVSGSGLYRLEPGGLLLDLAPLRLETLDQDLLAASVLRLSSYSLMLAF